MYDWSHIRRGCEAFCDAVNERLWRNAVNDFANLFSIVAGKIGTKTFHKTGAALSFGNIVIT